MIGRTESVEFPDRARQQAIGQLIAIAPPPIPRAAQKRVGRFLGPGQVCREQPADAQQPRLQVKRGLRAARPARLGF